MSVKAITWAFNLRLDDSFAKIVLVALADHYSDENECCWPSIERLELFTGADERTIQRKIALLIELGHISKEERPGRSNVFYLACDNPRHSDTPLQNPRQAATSPPSRRRGSPVTQSPHPRHSDTQNPQGTVSETSRNAPPGSPAPEGARPLTPDDEWQRRLDGYRSGKVSTWTSRWGPMPDSAATSKLVPAHLLKAWQARRKVEVAGGEQVRAPRASPMAAE